MDPRVQRHLKRAMTVESLIEELKQFPKEAIVGFQSNYGDYHRTQQFLTVIEVRELDPDTERIANTAYSHSGLSIEEKRERDEPSEEELAELTAEEREEYEEKLKEEAEQKFVILG